MNDRHILELRIQEEDEKTSARLETFTQLLIPVQIFVENENSNQFTTTTLTEIVLSEDSCSDKTVEHLEDPSTIYCFFCEDKFLDKECLEDHISTHASDTIFECPDCGDVFVKLSLFITHINEFHNADIDLNRRHNAVVEGSCSIEDSRKEDCGNPIDDGSESDEWPEDKPPEKNSRKKNTGRYQCELCDSRFIYKNMLNLHVKKIHVGIKKAEFSFSDDKTSSVEQYECDLCGLRIYSKYHLRLHLRGHLRPITCQLCSQRFRDQPELQRHLKTHGSGYSCYECQLYFTEVSRYQDHIKRVHQKKKSFLCETCQKVFKKASDLKKHQFIHLGIKPYVCDCGKSFTHQTSLRHHKLTHNDSSEKLFVCNYCGMGFNYAGNLKVHMRKHTGQKPYKCKVCLREFARSANLNEHMHIHLELKTHHCKICEKSFTSSSALSKHKKIHLGVRDFVCNICEKTFVTQAHLASHLRIHSDERLFRCYECGKEFRRADTLKTHEKTHERSTQDYLRHSSTYVPSPQPESQSVVMAEESYSQQEALQQTIEYSVPEQSMHSMYHTQQTLPPPPMIVNDQNCSMHSMPQQQYDLSIESQPNYIERYSNTTMQHHLQPPPINYEPIYVPQPETVVDDTRFMPLYPYAAPVTTNVPPYHPVDPNFAYASSNGYHYQPFQQYHWSQMDTSNYVYPPTGADC